MSKWPMAPLGSVLSKSDDWITPELDKEYNEVTVRLWGKGVVLRGKVTGSEIAGGRRLQVRANQFILSRIDARNGATGLIPESLDGAVVTNDFPVYSLSNERVFPAFLSWMSKTASFVELCKRASEGTTNRVRLKEERFLATEIPLPPLPEQRRIVARIESLAAKIEEGRTIRHNTASETQVLLMRQVGRIFDELGQHHPERSFSSFGPHVTSGPRNWAKHYQEGGTRFYRAQDIGPNGEVLSDSKVFIEPPPGDQGRSAYLQPGDLMLVITGATVGRCSVFRKQLEPGFVSQHVGICRLPNESINSDFALWGLRGPRGQEQLLGQRYGQGKPGLNLSNIRLITLPIPPLSEQRRIVAYLDGLQAKVDALKKLQSETADELAALLPSILDKAFKGELQGREIHYERRAK